MSGETIDYGPCAFLDQYDPSTVYSSIDRTGRYAFGNQPAMAQWNLTRRGMRAKLGLTTDAASDAVLFDELLNMMQDGKADYTRTFRGLSDTLRGDDSALRLMVDDARSDDWIVRWRERLDDEGADLAEVVDQMGRINPLYIPRNHLVEEALEAAGRGNLSMFTDLLDVVTSPFVARDDRDRYASPPDDAFAATYQTFCGT